MRNPIKALAQRWTEEVLDARAQAKQDECEHLVSGTMKNGILTCDACDKVLTSEDEWYPESQSPMDKRYTDAIKEQA